MATNEVDPSAPYDPSIPIFDQSQSNSTQLNQSNLNNCFDNDEIYQWLVNQQADAPAPTAPPPLYSRFMGSSQLGDRDLPVNQENERSLLMLPAIPSNGRSASQLEILGRLQQQERVIQPNITSPRYHHHHNNTNNNHHHQTSNQFDPPPTAPPPPYRSLFGRVRSRSNRNLQINHETERSPLLREDGLARLPVQREANMSEFLGRLQSQASNIPPCNGGPMERCLSQSCHQCNTRIGSNDSSEYTIENWDMKSCAFSMVFGVVVFGLIISNAIGIFFGIKEDNPISGLMIAYAVCNFVILIFIVKPGLLTYADTLGFNGECFDVECCMCIGGWLPIKCIIGLFSLSQVFVVYVEKFSEADDYNALHFRHLDYYFWWANVNVFIMIVSTVYFTCCKSEDL